MQTSLMPRFAIWGVHPDLMLIVVVSWALSRGYREGLGWALIGGLVLDLLSSAPFGAFTVSLLATSLLVGSMQSFFFGMGIFLPIVAATTSTFVYDIVILAFLQALGHPTVWGSSIGQVILPSAVLNTLFMIPVYWIIRWACSRPEDSGREL